MIHARRQITLTLDFPSREFLTERGEHNKFYQNVREIKKKAVFQNFFHNWAWDGNPRQKPADRPITLLSMPVRVTNDEDYLYTEIKYFPFRPRISLQI